MPPSPSRLSRTLGVLTLLASASCGGVTGACNYRIRSTAALGTVQTSSGTMRAEVQFFQSTAGGAPPTLRIGLGASPLSSGGVAVSLADTRRVGETLVSASVATAELTGNRIYEHRIADGRVADAVFAAIAGGTAVLTLDGPATGGSVTRVPLATERTQDWMTPRCD